MHRFVKSTRIRAALVIAGFAVAALASSVPVSAHADTTVAGGPSNIVIVQNQVSGSLRVRGLVQLGRVPGPNVAPDNFASAINTCASGCNTLAVALQVNLVNAGYSVFAPQNVAVAVNGGCTGCVAEALALQYNIGVADPTNVPPRVDQLVAALKAEMAQVGATSTTLDDAETGMLTVIGEFQDLAGSLAISRDVQTTAPTAAAAPSAAARAPASTTTISPATAAPAPGPTPTPAAPQPSPDATPSASPEPSPSPA